MKNYSQLNQFERDRIEALLGKGHSQKEIAKVLKRDKSTVSREIKRHKKKNGEYEAGYAQQRARIKRRCAKYQGKKINEDDELKRFVIKGLFQCWNPDEISGRMKREDKPFYASKTAIYEWLYSVWGQAYCCLLPSRQCRAKRQAKPNTAGRDMIPNRLGIEALPPDFGLNPGDLETDTVLSGKKTGSKTALAVLCGVKAHYTRLAQIPNLQPLVNENAVQSMAEDFNNLRCMLRDNGLEGKHHEITPVPSYFCDPYSSWQKPHIENTNKLLRRFFPKGSDLGKYSKEYVQRVEWIINNKPRKCLGYRKPVEVALECGLLSSPPKVNRLAINFNRSLVALRG